MYTPPPPFSQRRGAGGRCAGEPRGVQEPQLPGVGRQVRAAGPLLRVRLARPHGARVGGGPGEWTRILRTLRVHSRTHTARCTARVWAVDQVSGLGF